MLKTRNRRIQFLIFTVIIFSFYIFYSDETRQRIRLNNEKVSSIADHPQRLNLEYLFININVYVFLDHFKNKLSIDSFLIEPYLLYNYLNGDNLSYFRNNNLNANVFRWRYDLNCFGLKVPSNLTDEERNQFFNKICQNNPSDQSGDMKCSIFYGDDHSKEWKLNDEIKETSSRFKIQIGYLFTHVPTNRTAHLVLFFNRSNSLWTGKIDDVNDFQMANFKFGLYEELFDDFPLESPMKNVHIPRDVLGFLMQKNNSRLIECDHLSAREYYKKYSTHDHPETKYIHETLQTIHKFKEMMADHRLPFAMSAGTLLGWYRQCNLISYTDDVDFMVDARFASTETTDRLINNDHGFKFLFIWGQMNKGLEYAMAKSAHKIDLFFFYPTKDEKVTMFVHSKSSYIRLFYPKFDFCTGQLRGARLNVPCNVEDYLAAEYGMEWRKPISEWNYFSSSNNKGPVEYWPRGARRFRQFNLNFLTYVIKYRLTSLYDYLVENLFKSVSKQ